VVTQQYLSALASSRLACPYLFLASISAGHPASCRQEKPVVKKSGYFQNYGSALGWTLIFLASWYLSRDCQQRVSTAFTAGIGEEGQFERTGQFP
jgi:hypothetical protein